MLHKILKEIKMLGSNVSTVGGLPIGFKNGDAWGCECIQFYVTLSRRWNIPDLKKEEVLKFKNAWQTSSVKKVVSHVPFLVNLCSNDRELQRKSIARLVTEVSYNNKFSIPFLVLHPGSYGESTREDGIKRLIEALNIVTSHFKTTSSLILLETMAGQGTTLGSSFEELKIILSQLEKKDFFGICFDTSHVFIAGYDIRGYKGYENIFKTYDETIGVESIKVIHLNDAKTNLGSKNDKHAAVGEGQIGLQFFHALLRDKRLLGIPKILEIPERDQKSKDSLIFLRKLKEINQSIEDNAIFK
jgi:deoxyribonuclease-4